MIKKNLLYFLMLGGFSLGFSSHAVINGQILGAGEFHAEHNPFQTAPGSAPLLKIWIQIPGLPDEPCSGVVLNSKRFVTASHCFLLNDYLEVHPRLCLETQEESRGNDAKAKDSLESKEKWCLNFEDYTVAIAPRVSKGARSQTRKLKKVVRIEVPDLAVVKLKLPLFGWGETNAAPKSFYRLSMDIPKWTMEPPDAPLRPLVLSDDKKPWPSTLLLTGIGCTTYPATRFLKPEGMGVFHWQAVNSISIDKPGQLKSEWHEGDKQGAACWGDSGGGAFEINGGEPLLYGLVSGIKPEWSYDDGHMVSTTTLISHWHDPQTLEWLKAQLAED